MDGRITCKKKSFGPHIIKSDMSFFFVCALWSALEPLFDPAAVPYLFLNTGLEQWPHRQHQYHSTCLLFVTHEQNEIMQNNIESSRDKHVAQYLFEEIVMNV